MADITGQFKADFAPFNAAVQGAEVKLKSFEAGSAKVSDQLSRMTNAFSGQKVMADAALMVEAVERLGGTSTLTEKELARLGATVKEASEKMEAAGLTVPDKYKAITAEVGNANKAHEDLIGTVKSLALGFVAMFSVQQAYGFVTSVLDQASALQDLSNQTHINVEDLQTLSGAMSEFGVDADSLGKGLFGLSQKVAGDDASVAHALHTMGMSLDEVKGKSGEELFMAMENGLSKLQGGLRDTTATDLFGAKLGAAMAGASDDIEETIAAWREHNKVVSGENIAAMDKYGESINRANKSLTAIAANAIGPVAQGFNVLFDTIEKGASKWTVIASLLPKGLGGIGTGTEALTRLIDDQNKKLEESAAAARLAAGGHREMNAAVVANTAARTFLAALEKDAGAALTLTQIANLEHLKAIGQLTAQNAIGIGVSAGAFEKYTAGITAAKTAATELAAAQKEADAQATASYQHQLSSLQSIEAARLKSYGVVEQIAMLGRQADAEDALARAVYAEINGEKERMKIIEDAGARHTAITQQKMALEAQLTQQIATSMLAELEAKNKVNAMYAADSGAKVQVDILGDLDKAVKKLQASEVEGQPITERVAALTETATRALQAQAIAGQGAAGALDHSNQAASDVPAVASQAAGGFNQLGASAQQAGSSILSMTADLYNAIRAAQAADALTNIIPTFGASGYLGSHAPGARAAGGPVSAGTPYMVGERGPELFVPKAGGTILPNGAGGRVAITVNVTQPLGTPQAVAAAVGQAVIQSMRQSGQRLPAGG